jgi:hypothetical protein
LPDKASLYLELVEAYKSAEQMHEAAKVSKFQGTIEEGRVTIANANLALQGRYKISLGISSEQRTRPTILPAGTCKMADIHLNHHRDRHTLAEFTWSSKFYNAW